MSNMSKRTKNRIILIVGFLICLAVVITVITLIIVGISKAVSGGGSDQTGEIAQVEVIYDANLSSAASSGSNDTSSTNSTTESSTASSDDQAGDDSSSATSTVSATSSSTNDDSKSPEDFVADFASSNS